MKQLLSIVIGVLLHLSGSVFGQDKYLDSLISRLKEPLHDTVRCSVLSILAEKAPEGKWESYNQALFDISSEKIKTTGVSSRSYKLFLRFNATALCNKGFLAKHQGNIVLALDYYLKALKIYEASKDNNGLGVVLINIGVIYKNQNEMNKAIEYYRKGLTVFKNDKNKKGEANAVNNMGKIFMVHGNVDSAYVCFLRSYSLTKELGSKKGMGLALNSIGNVFEKRNEPDSALKYYREGLRHYEETNGKEGIVQSYYCLGGIYLKKKNYREALDWSNKALQMSEELGYPERIKFSAWNLWAIHKATGNYKEALVYHELYHRMSDSISNQESQRAAIRSQFQYKYDKQAAQDSIAHAKETQLKNLELAKQEAELRAKRNTQYALYSGMALIIVFAGFMFNRFRVTQRQKHLIEKQKRIVEEKQKEVMDSIKYAQKIQRAHLPSERSINNDLGRLKDRI